jgi:hypothetical protein
MAVQETRMMARALTQRWPLSPEYRTIIVKQLMKVIADPQSSPREKTSAAKALMAAEQQNQADEHKLVDVRVATRNDRYDAIAAELGIDIGTLEDATGSGEIAADRTEIDSGPVNANGG